MGKRLLKKRFVFKSHASFLFKCSKIDGCHEMSAIARPRRRLRRPHDSPELLFQQDVDGIRHDRQNVVIKVQIENIGELKPLRIVEAAVAFFEFEVLKF